MRYIDVQIPTIVQLSITKKQIYMDNIDEWVCVNKR